MFFDGSCKQFTVVEREFKTVAAAPFMRQPRSVLPKLDRIEPLLRMTPQ